jgi:hypothetical protein
LDDLVDNWNDFDGGSAWRARRGTADGPACCSWLRHNDVLRHDHRLGNDDRDALDDGLDYDLVIRDMVYHGVMRLAGSAPGARASIQTGELRHDGVRYNHVVVGTDACSCLVATEEPSKALAFVLPRVHMSRHSWNRITEDVSSSSSDTSNRQDRKEFHFVDKLSLSTKKINFTF